MFIETERLIVRSLKNEDEAAFTAMASDGSLNDVGFNEFCSSWMKEWIIEAIGLDEANDPTADYLAYAISLKGQDTAIGCVGCSYYKDLQKVGLTYFIGAQHRKMGYAVEAVKAYTNYFFAQYKFASLIATIKEENIPSWKVIEKVGFRFAGTGFYKDINDETDKLYRFYEIKQSLSGSD